MSEASEMGRNAVKVYRCSFPVMALGAAFVAAGAIDSWISLDHLLTGTPAMFTYHGDAFSAHVASRGELISLAAAGAFCILVGLLWLIACLGAGVVLDDRGLTVKRGFGRIVRQVAWSEISGVRVGTSQVKHYWLDTTTRPVRLSGVRDLDGLAQSVAERLPLRGSDPVNGSTPPPS